VAMMEQIHKFVDANGQRFKRENIKSAYKVYIILLVLTLLSLPFVGGTIGALGLTISPLYCIAACTYNHYILGKSSIFREIFMSSFYFLDIF
jgi:hypothetical protein